MDTWHTWNASIFVSFVWNEVVRTKWSLFLVCASAWVLENGSIIKGGNCVLENCIFHQAYTFFFGVCECVCVALHSNNNDLIEALIFASLCVYDIPHHCHWHNCRINVSFLALYWTFYVCFIAWVDEICSRTRLEHFLKVGWKTYIYSYCLP